MIKPQQVRIWLNSFIWGHTLIRTECFGLFQNGAFSPPPIGSTRGFFSDIDCENLVQLQEVKFHRSVGAPWWLAPPGVFMSEAYPWWALAICQLPFLFFYLGTGSHGGYFSDWLWSQFFLGGGQWFSLWPHFFKDLRRIVEFLLCSAFYIGWSGNFQALLYIRSDFKKIK